MKIEEKILVQEQELSIMKQNSSHCQEMHNLKMDNISKQLEQHERQLESICNDIQDNLDASTTDYLNLSKKVDKQSHSLNILAKEVTVLLKLKDSINSNLWKILVTLLISLLTSVGSVFYNNFIYNKPEIKELEHRLESIQKMMENNEKYSSKEKKNEPSLISKP